MNSYSVLILLLACTLSWCVDMRPRREPRSPSINSDQQSSPPQPNCVVPYDNVGSRCIFVNNQATGTWAEGKDMCHQFDGRLIKLDDVNLMADLVDYIKMYGITNVDYWIGGSDAAEEGNWVWLDGSPMRLGTPFWGHMGITDQAPNGGTGENCAYLNKRDYFFMNDWNCDEAHITMGSICEYLS